MKIKTKNRIKYQVKNNKIIFSTLGLTIAPNSNKVTG